MKTKRALVTGATGFVGSHLCRKLEEAGWDVRFVVRGKSRNARSGETLPGKALLHDGTTEGMARLVGAARPDVVFHLASLFLAEHKPGDVEALCRSNVLFGTQLLDAMAAHKVPRLVNTGTGWQHYGDAPYDPVSLYAATKQAFEDILAYYVGAHGLCAVTLTIFDSYGPGDPRPKIWNLLKKAEGSFPMSPGRQKIHLVHIEDVVEAYRVAAERLLAGKTRGHEGFALASDQAVSLRRAVAVYLKTTGKRLQILWGGRPYRKREILTPWRGGRRIPGWRPKISLEEGFRSMNEGDIYRSPAGREASPV